MGARREREEIGGLHQEEEIPGRSFPAQQFLSAAPP